MRSRNYFTRRKLLPSFLVLLVAGGLLTLSACDSFVGGTEASGSSRLEVRLVDAPFPFELVDSVNVTISRVTVHSEESGSVIISDEEQQYNLLELQDGVSALIGDVSIEPGTYQQVRLYVDDARIYLTNSDEYDIKVPSERIKVILNDLVVEEDEDVTLTLDFDVSKSFVVQGNPDTPAGIKGFIFKPTIVPVNIDRKFHDDEDEDDGEEDGDDENGDDSDDDNGDDADDENGDDSEEENTEE